MESKYLEIARAALSGDKILSLRLVSQLARSMDAKGHAEDAEELRSLLSESKTTFSLQRASSVEKVTKKRVESIDPTDLADLTSVDSIIAEAPILNSSVERRIQEFLQFVERSDELVKAGLGITPSMLLYGPPGNGKTFSASYIAKLLSLPLYTARCDTLVSSYLGSTSKNIRSLFDFVSEQPCVLFLDEFDALAKARDDQHELGELKRVVVSLLQNIDSLPSTTILLAATNHENLLDSAVWRRFAYRLEVGKPDEEAREKIVSRLLNFMPVISELSCEISIITKDMSVASIEQTVKATLRHSILNNAGNLDVYHLIRGVFEVQGWFTGNAEHYLEEVVKKLRDINSKVFTIRRISSLLGISSAKVSRIK